MGTFEVLFFSSCSFWPICINETFIESFNKTLLIIIQEQKNLVDKLAKEASKHYPPGTKGDGVCEDGEGFGCIGEVTSKDLS